MFRIDITKNAGTSSWPSWISHFTGSFVGHSPSEMLCPPALVLGLERERTEEEKKREVLHLFRCYTHTDTHTHTKRQGKSMETVTWCQVNSSFLFCLANINQWDYWLKGKLAPETMIIMIFLIKYRVVLKNVPSTKSIDDIYFPSCIMSPLYSHKSP